MARRLTDSFVNDSSLRVAEEVFSPEVGIKDDFGHAASPLTSFSMFASPEKSMRMTSTPVQDSSPFRDVSLNSSASYCTPATIDMGFCDSFSINRADGPSASTSVPSPWKAVEDMAVSGLWVFGYGSLCWHPGFEFSSSHTGYIKGYSRKFWQGNTSHRGTPDKPGRVATLVEEKEGVVWGRSFQVQGDAAMPYLNNRECDEGGYRTILSTFHPRDTSLSPFPVLIYVATPSNKYWLGESPLADIAKEIIQTSGSNGHNVEYVLRLAEYTRVETPEAKDDHLFRLEQLVLEQVCDNNLEVDSLMEQNNISVVEDGPDIEAVHIAPVAEASTQFSKRVPSKKLRCVDI